MSTVILYMSKHGTTRKVANLLKDRINNEVDLIDLRNNKKPDLNLYDCIIIGGSIHMGVIQKKIKQFSDSNSKQILNKKLGLFLCCMYEDKQAQEQFQNVYSKELRNHAKANALLGGEFILEKMNFFEKLIVKKVSGFKETVSNIKMEELEQFAQKMNVN